MTQSRRGHSLQNVQKGIEAINCNDPKAGQGQPDKCQQIYAWIPHAEAPGVVSDKQIAAQRPGGDTQEQPGHPGKLKANQHANNPQRRGQHHEHRLQPCVAKRDRRVLIRQSDRRKRAAERQ